jgi:hypothetical protein
MSPLVIDDATGLDGVIMVRDADGGPAGAVPAMQWPDRPGARVFQAVPFL